MSEQDDDRDVLALLRWHPRYREDVESQGDWAAKSLLRLLADGRAVVTRLGDRPGSDVIAPAARLETEQGDLK